VSTATPTTEIYPLSLHDALPIPVSRLRSGATEREENIVVPDGNATLEVHANDTAGKPIAHLEFVMRFEGELIPPDVADMLQMVRSEEHTSELQSRRDLVCRLLLE